MDCGLGAVYIGKFGAMLLVEPRHCMNVSE